MGRVSNRLPTPPGRTAPTGASGRLARHLAAALAAVVAGFLAMGVTAALGLWAAGATDLPGGAGAFVAVLAAVVVMATGGRIGLSGEAGALAGTQAQLTAMPLTVTLVGALVTGSVFLLPLRHHAVARAGDLLTLAVPTVVLWLAALGGLSALARHDFPITLGGGTTTEETGDLGDLFKDLLDATNPSVGFRTDVGPTLFYGLLWILGVLVVALLVSRRTPLPPRLVRHHQAVRPAASAMLLLLLAYVAVGLVIGLVVAATKGHAAETLAVLLLGLPNVSWLALGVGIGGSWEGRAEGPFGLPMPQILDGVLRGGDGGRQLSTVDLSTLAAQDGRAWWLLPVAAVLTLAAGFVMAARSPARVPLWRHALHLGLAFAATLLVVIPLTFVEARFGLSILGIGDLEALGAEVLLIPHVWKTVGLGLLWGLVAGFLGGLLATRVHRRGEVETTERPGGTDRQGTA
ncbi:streptophobe family protein [Streptomyces sp. NPDC006339]|uniref:streptophobe family protein n=1 Tax=Streptomyces sp. NPDC006339 TaxID=3156755 RepID=UPI0033BB4C0F